MIYKDFIAYGQTDHPDAIEYKKRIDIIKSIQSKMTYSDYINAEINGHYSPQMNNEYSWYTNLGI